MLQHTQTFTAKNAAGMEITLHAFQDIKQVPPTFTSGTRFVEGLKELKTDDGMSVNWISKGQYEVVLTGEKLTSDEPDAP